MTYTNLKFEAKNGKGFLNVHFGEQLRDNCTGTRLPVSRDTCLDLHAQLVALLPKLAPKPTKRKSRRVYFEAENGEVFLFVHFGRRRGQSTDDTGTSVRLPVRRDTCHDLQAHLGAIWPELAPKPTKMKTFRSIDDN